MDRLHEPSQRLMDEHHDHSDDDHELDAEFEMDPYANGNSTMHKHRPTVLSRLAARVPRNSPKLYYSIILAFVLVMVVAAMRRASKSTFFNTQVAPPSTSAFPPHRTVDDHSARPINGTKRKALVMASYKAQEVDWLQMVPPDWEIFRYVNDDPNAKFRTPVTIRTEAIAYLTFILDEYYRLPDYMFFSHGARRAWHQPEPTDWLVEALNLTALDEEQYISARCKPGYYSGGRRMNLQNFTHWIQDAHVHLPLMWEWFELGPLPEELESPCCAQFGVTKEAILKRPYSWWEHFRAPLLGVEGLPDLGKDWGYIYEQLWHVAMGKETRLHIDRDECMRRQWSYGILCNMYPVPPLPDHMQDINEWANVECFKNTNDTKEWEILTIWEANYTDIKNQRKQRLGLNP